MAYKCIPFSGGVDVSVNESNYFTFRSQTHNLINTGNGNVRIQRKIDMLFEVLDTPITDFVDTNEVVIATTYAQLSTYFLADRNVMAGEGVSVVNGTVSIVAGGPSTLGGFKVGTGLVVDGSGRLSASATSEITRVLNTEAEMLALPVEELRSYRVIRLDTKRLYYTNAGATPSVLGNWFLGPSIEAAVLSFKGRTGAIEPELGDYNFDLVTAVDKTSAVTYKLVVDAGKLYIQNTSTSARVEISYATDIGEISSKITLLEDLVSSPTGLVSKVANIEDDVARNTDIISNSQTGLVTRVKALEDAPSGGTDYGPQIQQLQNKDAQQDVLINQVDAKADSVSSNNVILDQRVTTLENRPAGVDYSPQIAALQNKDVAQDTRLSAAEAALLNKAGLVAGKVPYDQLPEFPVGRKVNVANQSARLALTKYTDLTIAYQSDTGDAWGLDANADPVISSNWSKLGNAQGIGVASFNGRTGNIGPMAGDYDSGKITELVNKRFVSDTQINDWNAKETLTGAQNKATIVKDYADNTFLTKLSRGSINGVAPLGADGKVPVENLPAAQSQIAIPVSTYADMKASRVANTWYRNTSTYDRDIRVYVAYVVGFVVSSIEVMDTSGVVTKFDSLSVGSNASNSQIIDITIPANYQYRFVPGVANRTITAWYEWDKTAGSTFVPVSEKNRSNGVAPLDANGKVPLINLPTGLPQATRIWRDVKDTKTVGAWTTNSSGNEMIVQLRTEQSTSSSRWIQGVIRKDATDDNGLTFYSDSTAATSSHRHNLTLHVPAGWQYIIVSTGGTTIAATQLWYEFS